MHPSIPLLVLLLTFAAWPAAAQTRDAERACEREANDRGYRLADVYGTRDLYADGRVGAVLLEMEVWQSSGRAEAICIYTFASGGVRFEVQDRQRPYDGRTGVPAKSETRATCLRAVERRDFRVLRDAGNRTQRDNRDNAIGHAHVFLASRDRREWRVECNYSFASGRTEVDYFPP